MHIGDWLSRREMLTPDKVALVDAARGGRRITFRQWNRAVNRTARQLLRLGVRRGDRVAVLATNCVEYLDLFFAVGKLGAALQCLSWRLLPAELARLVERARPVLLAYSADLGAQVEELRQAPGGALQGLAISERARQQDAAMADRDREEDDPPPPAEVGWDDPWALCYTGGTTGLPKAAVLTHRSITANAVNTIVSWGLTAEDRAILDAPLFHTGGLNVFTTPLVYVGGASVLCQRFAPEQTLDLLTQASTGVTLYFGVPTMLLSLQQHPRFAEADLRRLKLLISGGAPCPQPIFDRFWERGVAFKTGYGLTEAGPNNFWLPQAEVRRKPGAVGFPLMHVEARVCRPDGAPCAPDEVGELLLRGPHLCAGYLDDPQASAALLRTLPGAPAGPAWLHTGDLARRDEEGCFYIVGRQKDLFISGGENVYPAEIESALHEHPAVLEAAVIGVADERWGEVGRAVVVPRQGTEVAEAELLAFLRGRLARYKVPRSVVFMEALPKTGAGKVDKQRLRALHPG